MLSADLKRLLMLAWDVADGKVDNDPLLQPALQDALREAGFAAVAEDLGCWTVEDRGVFNLRRRWAEVYRLPRNSDITGMSLHVGYAVSEQRAWKMLWRRVLHRIARMSADKELAEFLFPRSHP